MTMELNSSDIPQANNLAKVLQTLEAVHSGCQSDKEIAQYIGYTPRQARYYRRAVEILGFIVTIKNNSTLTETGKDFVIAMKLNPNHLELLKPYIVKIPIIREVLEIFEDKENVSRDDFLIALLQVSGLDPNETTALRRLSTFIAWLDQIGLLIKRTQAPTTADDFQIIPYVPVRPQTPKNVIFLYDEFLNTLQPYLSNDEENISISSDLYQAITKMIEIEEVDELSTFIKLSKFTDKAARLMLSISEKDQIDLEKLRYEIKSLKKQLPTPERVLLERYRSLKSAANAAYLGGNGLEDLIIDWFKNHQVKFKKNHLFKNLSKNCDFYSEDLHLVVEAKYSKTSGTKHAGAIKDLAEIAKVKESHPEYKVGIAIAGNGFIEDKATWSSLKSLYQDHKIDFILTPKDLEKLSPHEINRFDFPDYLRAEDLILDLENRNSTWQIKETEDELGLIDATRWLNKYSKLSYLNFESLLQTWISQTPFAVQCLRLILNWSESRMEGYIKHTIPSSVKKWKKEIYDFDSVLILVKSISNHLSTVEKESIKNFFDINLTYADLVATRELGLSGWARKKKDSNIILVTKCKAMSSFKISEEIFNLSLPNEQNIKSSFSYIDESGKLNHVICKYYTTNGSVQSDLVKTIEALCETNHKDDWVLITDGTGWLGRDKDLRRLLTLAASKKFRVLTLQMWEGQQNTKVLKKRIL
ncbi:hypothetical protein DOM21_14795 [Bacteriovorax stolpii]|uniref:DpnII family type II restriction endonuclease n=1 Tax=Bacteriovorax stolpii TaxID=960 RepID=UPI00115A427E|nr:DpnII family type II restriction endonuclease [Bacteriovorax stolpii]QDK42694.1 hypothetical protein DOM21_14795 [Bacteriovorax stolpii]